jgi:hypothetical protein
MRSVYQEPFDCLADARRRELEIKDWKSARRIRELFAERLERAV